MSAPRDEGWAYPKAAARKAHFFIEGRSLCGAWAYLGTIAPGLLFGDNERCKGCQRKNTETRVTAQPVPSIDSPRLGVRRIVIDTEPASPEFATLAPESEVALFGLIWKPRFVGYSAHDGRGIWELRALREGAS